MSDPGTLTLTAAICTRNRPAQLARALQSLSEQSVRPAEILVIDNAPANDSTEAMVAERFPDVRYVREPVPGLDFARNRALREARHEVVAFLDDDAVAHRDWARGMLATFEGDARIGICTGRVEALMLETEAQRIFEANGGFSRGPEQIRLPRDADRHLHGRKAPLIAWAVSVGCGCSFAVRRRLALELGGFDEALGLGAELHGGDDHDMLWRVLESGADVVYEPAVLAWHEHRRETGALFDQLVGHQRGLVAFLTKIAAQTPGSRRLPLLGFLGWRVVKPIIRLARRPATRDPLPVQVLLRMAWACLSGLTAYPRARRIAADRRRQFAT